MAEKPFLSAAFLCEKVLRETDEVLTAVRIVDTFYVTVPKTLPPGMKPSIQTTLLLSFTKTLETGAQKHRAKIRVYNPSGSPVGEEPLEVDMIFKDEAIAKCNLVINLGLGIEGFGRYRIDVFVDDDKPVTHIPFMLLERPESATIVQ